MYYICVQAIERFAQPGSDHLYTVVNKKAPGTSGTSTAAPKGPSPPAPRGRDSWADPPYVNQASFPASTASDKPVLYRKSPVSLINVYICVYVHAYNYSSEPVLVNSMAILFVCLYVINRPRHGQCTCNAQTSPALPLLLVALAHKCILLVVFTRKVCPQSVHNGMNSLEGSAL